MGCYCQWRSRRRSAPYGGNTFCYLMPPKTAKQLAAKRNQEEFVFLLLANTDEYLLKFYNVADAKSLCSAIKARNKPDIDEIDIDDLYNNLRVYEDEMKRSSSSTSTSQNLAFLSSKNASSTNEVSTASGDFGVSTAGGISQVSTTPCSHDVACSFFAQPTTSPQLENEDFQQIDEDDLEELDLRWQALVAQDGLGSYDWSNDFEVEPVNYALMAISSSSSSSSSDNEGYELALESLESRILVHEKNELAWGEYKFQNYELKCREIKINNFNLELEKVVKERDELKIKIEKWEESSKNLDELLNSQMNARYKTSLGYGIQLNEMSNNSKTDSKISLSVFDVRLSDEENTPANDRFSKADGFHVVPPPITGNFLTTRSHISFASLDEYAIRKKIIKDKVIIEDWNSDDEDDVSEVQNSLSGISEILFTGSLQCVSVPSVLVVNHTTNGHQFTMSNRHQELASPKQMVLIFLLQAHDEEQQQSPSRITYSPSLCPQPTKPFPSPEPLQPTHEAEETASMPHDSPLHAVHSYGSAEGSMQQHDLTGKKISQIDEDLTISLVQDEGISWIPQEEEVHEKPSDETKVIIQEETPTEIIEEHGSGEKGEIKISTASPLKVTKVSIAEAHVYTRRKAKDKGKAIMEEPATPKKLKKRTQVQLSMDEELARKIEEEEERARFNAEQEARALQKEEEEERLNLEAAWELQKQLDERQQVPTEATQSKGIDWNDPSVLKYHALKNKHVSIAQARNILEEPRRVWDHVNTFIPMGSEVEKGSSKPSKRETSKAAEEENVEKEDVKPDPVMSEKKSVGTRRKTLARRRASDKQVEDRSKRQKKEKESDDVEQEKEDLRIYPIVNWEYQLPGRMEITDIEVYKLTRADGSASFHGDEQDEIWKNQESWKVLRWRLYENSGVNSVFFIDTPMEINMLVEKKYPLKKEILEKMINLKLQAEEESTMAFELIKFTRSQIEEKQ
ncbi:hypothetical protein Tco_1346880 [Tanacetum coccineum]